ncbi:MAG: pilus assembly protein PilM [Candidatus Colwellbacteria bacterium]|jgi:hypothetical protein|nr:pilus assembly protein PilM [Candidatus Colwellbacteria bacterium]MDD4818838.1 pilus assembly protein PilM [Candidatus Colwellbacteria bacterium]
MKLPAKIIEPISSLLKKISPIEIAGGFVVSDSALRYMRFNENGAVAVSTSLRLPPGAVVQGIIKDVETVTAALRQIRGNVGIRSSRNAEVVLSIDSGAVYSQLFNLPQLEENALSEAAELNIQMISPINIKNAYYSYQVVGRSQDNGSVGGYELLGAFINASVIDNWITAFKNAGFLPIAVEFQALSIARAASEIAGIGKGDISLLLDVSSEGLDLIILKNGNLYFDYFYPWRLIQREDKSISIEKFKQVLISETSKVMNFSLSKFNGEIKSIWLSAENISDEMVNTLRAQFPSMPVSEINVGGNKLSALWLPVMGAAKRGMILRSEDDLISLGPLSVIEEYAENQIISMIKIWRNVFVITLCFFLFVFSLSNLFLRRVRLSTGQQSLRTLSAEESRELGELRGKADEFNKLVSFVGEASRQENRVYPFVSKVINLASNIEITRLSAQNFSQPIVLNGNAPSADAVIQFQKRLSDLPNITDLQLPLSSLSTAPNGRTAFVMSFRIMNLDF